MLAMVVPSFAGTAAPEFRGLWVHSWVPGLLSPAQIDETVKWAKDANLNALIVQVRKIGDAYYSSGIEPRAWNIQAGPDFDPLDYAIRQGHANGMEVHAWFNVFRVMAGASTPPANHVTNLHPEWLSKNNKGESVSPDGRFLDPGVPEVRVFLVRLITELLTKYNIDGINLDYIRYPGRTWGYNDISVARFNSQYGRTGTPSPSDPQWCDWRREQVTETVRAIYREINRLKPQVKLSAATIPWGACRQDFTKTDAYAEVFQDWRAWMKEGILDANIPMNYRNPSSASDGCTFIGWLDGVKRWSYGRHVYCGLMTFKSALGTASQARIARDRGLQGIVGFAFSQTGPKEALAAKLKQTVFAEPAPVPEMPWKKK